MIGKSGDNPALSKRLTKTLLLTLIAVLIVATIAAAVTAYLEASDNQDETLQSVANLLTNNQLDITYDPELFRHADHDDGIYVQELDGNKRQKLKIKSGIDNGFHTIAAKGDLWRVLVVQRQGSASRLAVAQALDVSAEIATRSALNTALPLLFLLLLAPVLVVFIVRHSFRPLNRLAEKAGSDDSLKLDASDNDEIPLEVLPFISAISTLLEKNEQYNQRQRRFIADAAHELRTPITALSLEIDNLLRAKDDHSRSVRQRSLSQSVQRLQRLVSQLLDLARAQSADHQTTAAVSLNDEVKTQIGDLYALAENKQVELIVERNDTLRVQDVNHQLQHLIRNALANAIKFTPEGGEVTVNIFAEKNQAVLRVDDTGPGVSDQHITRLHEPFYRPDEQASGQGAGLGLAICQEIAAKLGGKLNFSNLQPQGFRFQFTVACI